jgi:hypothetical protein
LQTGEPLGHSNYVQISNLVDISSGVSLVGLVGFSSPVSVSGLVGLVGFSSSVSVSGLVGLPH